MKKIQVLGVTLFDYSLREAMRKVDGYLRDGKVSTISYVTIRGVLEADEDQTIKDFVTQLDMVIPADTDILRASNAASRNRIREIENNEFMEEFLKRLYRLRKHVYLLAETDEKLEVISKYISSYQEHIKIAGRFSLEQLQADEDFVVNDINMMEPDVIISLLSSSKRIDFFTANHMKLNAKIWLMLKDDMNLSTKKSSLVYALYNNLTKHTFKRRVNKYNNDLSEVENLNKEDKK